MKQKSPELDPNSPYIKTKQNIPKIVRYISGGKKPDQQYLNKWYWDDYNLGERKHIARAL